MKKSTASTSSHVSPSAPFDATWPSVSTPTIVQIRKK